MSSSIIDRDARQQQSFGEALVNFETEMRSCCQSLRGHITEAWDNVQADNARQALSYLLELVEGIEQELPGAEEFGARQKTLGKTVEEAENFRFSRR